MAPPLQQMLQSGYRLPTRPLFLENLLTLLGPMAGVFATGIKNCDRLQVLLVSFRFCHRNFAAYLPEQLHSPFVLDLFPMTLLFDHFRQMRSAQTSSANELFYNSLAFGCKGPYYFNRSVPIQIAFEQLHVSSNQRIFIEVPDGRPLEYRKSSFGFLGWTLRQWSNRTCTFILVIQCRFAMFALPSWFFIRCSWLPPAHADKLVHAIRMPMFEVLQFSKSYKVVEYFK